MWCGVCVVWGVCGVVCVVWCVLLCVVCCCVLCVVCCVLLFVVVCGKTHGVRVKACHVGQLFFLFCMPKPTQVQFDMFFMRLGGKMHTITEDTPFPLREVGTRLGSRGAKIWISSAEDDTANPPAMQERFMEQLPSSELLKLPAEGWGHMHIQNEDFFSQIMSKLTQLQD